MGHATRLHDITSWSNMDWKIVDSLASPDTGTIFTVAQTAKAFKYVLWFRGDYFLRQGQTITTRDSGLYVDGKPQELNVIHASPFNARMWQNLLAMTDCPGNKGEIHSECPRGKRCLFALCPWGMKSYIPEGEHQDQKKAGI